MNQAAGSENGAVGGLQIEAQVQRPQSIADPAARAGAAELVASVLERHAAALQKMLAILQQTDSNGAALRSSRATIWCVPCSCCTTCTRSRSPRVSQAVNELERTLEDQLYVAVTIDEDPGRDLGELRQVGHRFFFRAEEIEPLSPQRGGT